MRILHISTTDNAGAGGCCLNIHKSLLRSGVDSKLLVLNNTQNAEREYQFGFFTDAIYRIFSWMLRKVGLKGTERNVIIALSHQYSTTYSLPVSPVNLTKCQLVEWADIIHLHWVNNYLDYPSFFNKIEKPIVWTLHDENLFYGIAHHHKSILVDHPMEQKYRKLKYNSVRNAKNLNVVFLSQMMYDAFGKEDIIEGRKKFVINNFVNTSVFKSYDKVKMRRKYGLDEHKLIFVFIAMNIADPNKGLDILSEVLFTINPDIEILAIGGNPWGRNWDNVRSQGIIKSQSEMCELISCADFMAMPSYQEAFSQSPMEAMACGLPVVAFPVSGTSELITKFNGVVCEDFTAEALKKGIRILMSRHYNPVEIRQDMINRFSPEAIAQRYIKLYHELI